jgi:hypothetical protein
LSFFDFLSGFIRRPTRMSSAGAVVVVFIVPDDDEFMEPEVLVSVVVEPLIVPVLLPVVPEPLMVPVLLPDVPEPLIVPDEFMVPLLFEPPLIVPVLEPLMEPELSIVPVLLPEVPEPLMVPVLLPEVPEPLIVPDEFIIEPPVVLPICDPWGGITLAFILSPSGVLPFSFTLPLSSFFTFMVLPSASVVLVFSESDLVFAVCA